jgi:Tfp pilus assembly protein PilV
MRTATIQKTKDSPQESRSAEGWPPKSAAGWEHGAARAFTLIEVMIACGIFFMATFAILALVSTTLRNARALQRGDVDAGMAASQIYQMLKTNRVAELSGSGDFGEAYPDYSYQYETEQYQSNGLLQVSIIVNRRDLKNPVDALTIWVYNPDARAGFGPNFR